MSNLTLSGIIYQISKKESGTSNSGKEWSRVDFIIDTDEKYTRKVCFSLFNNNCDLIIDHQEGDKVEVTFGIESKEYNGRWFTNVTAFGITGKAKLPEEPSEQPNDLPF